jgi:hypothetical protein
VEGHAGWKDSGGTAGFDIPRARERQAAGEMVGLYNGMRPSYGEPNAIDNFAADARVNPWICWKYKVDHYFYWETAFFADKQINIWERPAAGSLMYTGEDVMFPAEDRHVRGPIMSIRIVPGRRASRPASRCMRSSRQRSMIIMDPRSPTRPTSRNGPSVAMCSRARGAQLENRSSVMCMRQLDPKNDR